MISRTEPYAAVHETHSGVVMLLGERALKVKKPCRTPFLDFSTPELREIACARELDLNRRLAADVYLGVSQLADPLGGPAEPILVMRRMPEKARLSTRIATGGRIDDHLSAVAMLIARFHEKAERGTDIDAQATVEAVRSRWEANLGETADLLRGREHTALRTIGRLAERYLAGRRQLFDSRIRGRHIVDGHGDLIADDIFCLAEGPRVLDCLDFDDNLRYVDVVDDVAFLAMDLEFLGRSDLARLFLDRYLAAAHESAPSSLIDHYVAYRAVVRAKCDYLRAQQGRVESFRDAERHLRIAGDHLRRATVRLCTVRGLPGTGKSTVAAALAQRVGAVLISSDHIRKELQSCGVIAGAPGDFGTGLYAPEAISVVYETMRARAKSHLEQGRSVILDASWTDHRQLLEAAGLAIAADATHVTLQCVAPMALAASRIEERAKGDSDATPQIARAMAATMSADWPNGIDIDTTATIDESVEAAVTAWNAIT